MTRVFVAFLTLLVLAGCESVEDKDAKCQHIGNQPQAAVSGNDAVWFKNNCACNDTLITMTIFNRGVPFMNPCYYPGSLHSQKVHSFLAGIDGEAKQDDRASGRPRGSQTPDLDFIKQGKSLCLGRPIDKVSAHMETTGSLLTRSGEGTCGGDVSPTGARIERWTCFTQTWKVPSRNGRSEFQAFLVYSESGGPGKGWFLTGVNWQSQRGDVPIDVPVCEGVRFAP